MLICYTDGSCLKNGSQENSGGFGVVVTDNNQTLLFCYSKQNNNTTNNAEELKAIVYTMLKYGVKLDNWGTVPIVYSDSAYCVNTFNTWMFNWANNNWKKSDKKAPENLELIQAYYEHYKRGYRIDLRKCPGHNGILGNEIADKLATGKIDEKGAYELWENYMTVNQ